MDEESSKLLTFNSPCSHFKFLLIPNRIHSASEMCQAGITAIIESTEGCLNAQDDIIIWADTPELLEKRTIEVLQVVRRSGLKLNRAKCQFNQRQLTFLGHKEIAFIFLTSGSITDMSEPTNQKELQRFFGMITYLGKFLPNLNQNSTTTSFSGEGHYLVL